ncbi:MAG: hypothetical protein K0U60_02910 [Actinomycetia bacterium]|nr:hypothetical protein [Actinomycetes bacterium]MCH9800685.1 hypothetical protein [Actinomycetes bacterium]
MRCADPIQIPSAAQQQELSSDVLTQVEVLAAAIAVRGGQIETSQQAHSD